jgi:hypothetical protein
MYKKTNKPKLRLQFLVVPAASLDPFTFYTRLIGLLRTFRTPRCLRLDLTFAFCTIIPLCLLNQKPIFRPTKYQYTHDRLAVRYLDRSTSSINDQQYALIRTTPSLVPKIAGSNPAEAVGFFRA